ncbi:hypothetical protein [Urbifossiella limnaea]|uniref:Uncharacterized protein n=1 Tax=Urbifossiella limnaea TaxID=2528023 RepID=A0A517XTG9_9BACT|nr:hypothetical protein [Urbifossiella limnaea]QDU20793.1 hypothetical protein ETAA1_27540 [Urbifossiella limnaea]
MLAVAGLFVAVCAPRECQPAPDQPVRITVVTVLATRANKSVDERLVELAKEVQKRDAALTGFKLHASEAKSVAPGDSVRFDLVDGKKLEVKVERPRDENGRVALKIRPPGLGEVTYTCTCDRFFPVVTPHRTRDGETLIVAVMARPCMLKK